MSTTKDNYFICSVGTFVESINSKILKTTPDHVSGVGESQSLYWYDDDNGILYRYSNHWCNVRYCSWEITGNRASVIMNGPFIVKRAPVPVFKALNVYRAGKIVKILGEIKFKDLKWDKEKLMSRLPKILHDFPDHRYQIAIGLNIEQ